MVTYHRPLIAVTQSDHGRRLQWRAIRLAVRLAGGQAVRVTPSAPGHDIAIKGLIIAGGTDVHPMHYGQAPKIGYRYDHDRDQLELGWFRKAEAMDIPILGICRGAQLMNIARGGTLFMDVAKVFERASYPSGSIARIVYRKWMEIKQGSLLCQLIGCHRCRVNSLHTQAIDIPGERFVITAVETNGVVQCIEDPSREMMMGVQFHPELLIHQPRYRRIFNHLVHIARRKS